MQFVALHHVKIGNRFYTPGEIIDVVIPADKVDRLIENDAIRKIGASFSDSFESQANQKAPAEAPPYQREGNDEGDEPPTNPQYSMMEAGSHEPEDEQSGNEEAPEDEQPGEEAAEDMEEAAEEAPEIDAMDGIVPQPKAAKADKPKAEGRSNKK